MFLQQTKNKNKQQNYAKNKTNIYLYIAVTYADQNLIHKTHMLKLSQKPINK